MTFMLAIFSEISCLQCLQKLLSLLTIEKRNQLARIENAPATHGE